MIGDSALGAWATLHETVATPQAQRCWLHKTMNARTKSARDRAKAQLHGI